MSRNWTCYDGPHDALAASPADVLGSGSDLPVEYPSPPASTDAVVKALREDRNGVSCITFNANAGSSFESFLRSKPPPPSVRFIGVQEMKIPAADI